MAVSAPASIPRFHAAVAVVMVVALVGIGRLWAAPPEHPSPGLFALTFPTGKDFCNLYTIARMWADGLPLVEAYDSARYARFQSELLGAELPDGFYVWSYPPSMALIALPLAGLSYHAALIGWLAATLALLLFGASRIGLSRSELMWLALSPAAVFNVYFGHVAFLLAALLLAGFGWLERRPWLAGACFGPASVKPQLLLMVPFLLLGRRAWRALIALVATVVLSVLLSALVFGWESWHAFGTQAAAMQRYFLHYPAPAAGQPIALFQLLLVTPFTALRLLGAGLATSYVLQATCSLLAIAFALRLGATGAPRAVLAAWAAVGALLASPYAMAYDLVVLSAACLLVREGAGRSWFVPLAWLLPLLTVLGNYARVPFAPLVLVGFALAVGRAAAAHGLRASVWTRSA
jgi:alpha-1,2-mannosyltransferase